MSCAKSNSYNAEEYEAEREQSLDKGGCDEDDPVETADLPDNSEKGNSHHADYDKGCATETYLMVENEILSNERSKITFVLFSIVSLKSCVLSWFFLWHLVWLSVMQLRHFFFIGTLNPMLNRLADQDPDTGIFN